MGQRRTADAMLRDRECEQSDVTEVRIQSPLPPNDKHMSSEWFTAVLLSFNVMAIGEVTLTKLLVARLNRESSRRSISSNP